jgi:hypothetical protein
VGPCSPGIKGRSQCSNRCGTHHFAFTAQPPTARLTAPPAHCGVQNIGAMIKAHFKQSQFLVVSLKEGMFNNANVLFRTKFVDGVSTISRTVRPPHPPNRGRNHRERGGDGCLLVRSPLELTTTACLRQIPAGAAAAAAAAARDKAPAAKKSAAPAAGRKVLAENIA